ncbi:MAG: hypothetical protein OEY34_00375, partial [Cyclobacteriaceae bacterium]|nr:hypothetical protein [Cyclobacteriaceae bacterium]
NEGDIQSNWVPEEFLENPFPGLRPFTIDECHLFFGREGQSDELLVKLSDNKFVAILGYSGSGKSSLVQCGLIPQLYGGFMTNAGSSWNIITSRPGVNPYENLCDSILDSSNSSLLSSEVVDRELKKSILLSLLKSGKDGLIHALSQNNEFGQVNHLIQIDQFEELIRLVDDVETEEEREELFSYVNMLVHAVTQTEASIYIVITMRSDFVGDGAVFPELTKLINMSNYLVPGMSRSNIKMAIEGPIAVGGGRISGRLLNRLLLEVGTSQDLLPVLQHALMRSWNYWFKNREENEPIDIRHYNAIGKMSGALSQHADEIYDELDPKQKDIAQIMFKALTERGQENLGLRRSAKLSVITELSGATEEEVIEVIDAFRKQGRSFLMPPAGVELHKESIIEISHESLMRIWVRLKQWVDEEHESALMYKRLSDASAMYQVGRTGLWRPPDLQLALNWQKKQRPTRAWAQRYDEAFERAIVFLDTSRITYEAEQKNQEMLQKRLLRRAKNVAMILGLAAIIAIAFFVYGIVQRNSAESNYLLAQENFLIAQEKEKQAIDEKIRAEEQTKIAEEQSEIAKLKTNELSEALEQLKESNQQLQFAVLAEKNARDVANDQTRLAQIEREAANRARDSAVVARQDAEKNYNEAQKLLYLAVAQSLAAKSVNIEDNILKGLIAHQAYIFNETHGGRALDPYIYNGLYSALAQIDGKTYNTVKVHRNSIRSVDFPKNQDYYYTTGSDGKVLRTKHLNNSPSQVLASNLYSNRVVAVNSEKNILLLGSDSSQIEIINLNLINGEKSTIKIHQGRLNDLKFIPQSDLIVSTGADKTIRRFNLSGTQNEILVENGSEYKVIDVSKDGTFIAAGAEDGRIILMNLKTNKISQIRPDTGIPVFSVAFNSQGDKLAIGDESGDIFLWDVINNKLFKELVSHKSRVSDIEFSDDGKIMATASLDRTIRIWVLDEIDELPIVLDDNDAYVWDMDFSPDSRYLLAACDDGEMRVWATDPDLMAAKMCGKLSRNMTFEEWETYVGNDIPYMNTCVDKILNQ